MEKSQHVGPGPDVPTQDFTHASVFTPLILRAGVLQRGQFAIND